MIGQLIAPPAGRGLAAAEGGLGAAAAGVAGLDGHEAEGRADGGPGQGRRGQEEGGGGRLPWGQAARAPLQEEIFQCRVPGKYLVTTLIRRNRQCGTVVTQSQIQFGMDSENTIFVLFWPDNPSN